MPGGPALDVTPDAWDAPSLHACTSTGPGYLPGPTGHTTSRQTSLPWSGISHRRGGPML